MAICQCFAFNISDSISLDNGFPTSSAADLTLEATKATGSDGDQVTSPT